VVPYDDEQTPISLIGKKMLPILKHPTGQLGESLDIIALIDSKKKLKVEETVTSSFFKEFEALLNQISGPLHSIVMPYWIYTPEFSVTAREYFLKKKEEKRGPFSVLIKKRGEFYKTLLPILKIIESDLKPFYQSQNLGLKDILLASHLWGLYVVPEFQFSESLHTYLQSVKHICYFDYHEDFWRES
jgi:glutaredoxin 2